MGCRLGGDHIQSTKKRSYIGPIGSVRFICPIGSYAFQVSNIPSVPVIYGSIPIGLMGIGKSPQETGQKKMTLTLTRHKDPILVKELMQ